MTSSDLNTPDRVVLLLSLIPYLREHGPTPLAEVSAAFRVEERTLRSLISFLGMAGVPGETATYQDEDLFDIDWEALEEHDIVSLTRTVAVEDTPRFSGLEAATLRAGIHALHAMLPESEHATLAGLSEKLRGASAYGSDAPVLSVAPEPFAPVLTQLSSALNDSRQVELSYLDANGTHSHRLIDPLLLHQRNGQWYLRAWCYARDAERTFAVDRIHEIVPRETAIVHTEIVQPVYPHSLHSEATLTVQVQATDRGFAALAGFAPVRTSETDADGWATCEVELAHADVAVRLVQSLPGEVRVVSPAAARAAVTEWAQLALVAYDE